MQNFDYIELADFRRSLQSDYAEMQSCAETGNWKSAQVLAGSIVECLLVDYLASRYKEKVEGKDPLKMDLVEAIAACKTNGALTERTADLCTVIRSYRNLIHPGRMVRLKEKAPSKASCTIAVSLIDMIVEDIASTRREAFGFTGEQIIEKIRRDDQVLGILRHLLDDVREHQRLRLATELIPEAYQVFFVDDEEVEIANRLAAAHRVVLNSLPPKLKTTVTDCFAKILREEDGQTITSYRRAFFRGFDLTFLSSHHLPIVKQHLLSCMNPILNLEDLSSISGLGEFLAPGDVSTWLRPLVNALLSTAVPDEDKSHVRDTIIATLGTTSQEVDATVLARLDGWMATFKAVDNSRNVNILQELRNDIELPF